MSSSNGPLPSLRQWQIDPGVPIWGQMRVILGLLGPSIPTRTYRDPVYATYIHQIGFFIFFEFLFLFNFFEIFTSRCRHSPPLFPTPRPPPAPF